ncbi:urea transporter 2-like [Bacillus rossius redtenbacheri]|uniref:urea transporter 2-like n=1 Tax=Bacillus rossius redtenbacheri TaxID=93214 RepID=UPI002FDEF0E0
MLPGWTRYFGDFRAGSDFLDSKPARSLWALPMFLDSVCRAFGQVVFANNPVSGLVVVAALLVADPRAAAAGLFAASVATAGACLLGQPGGSVRAGLTSYSAVLVGTVTASLAGPDSIGHHVLWPALFVGAVLSVYVTAGLANALGSLRPALPCLTLPFNAVAWLLLACLQARGAAPPPLALGRNLTAHGHFAQMLSGCLLSAGQVYAVEDTTSSALVFLAVALFSPTLAAVSFTGALLGTLAGVMMLGRPGLHLATSGALGYNSLLSAAAVGGMFYVISWRSCLAAVFNAIMTSLVFVALLRPMAQVGLPVLTMPFVTSTLVFLACSSDQDGAMERPREMSFPERHRSERARRPPA